MVAVAAAVVASLGLVALGVQIGTNGLIGDGPGRNPGSSTATPASATVDLARTGSPSIDEIVLSIVPASGAGAFGSSSTASNPATAGSSTFSGPVSDGGENGPPGGPNPPAPTPPGLPLPPTPVPVPPPPAPLVPVIDPVIDVIEGASGSAADAAAPIAPVPVSSLEGLIQQLLGV